MRWALVGFLALVALFAVIRPMIRAALGPAPPVPALAAATAGAAPPPVPPPALVGGKTVAELEAEMEAAAAAKREVSRTPLLTKAISAKADAEPEHVAQIVRALLAQDEK
jgi:flagellar biosynthesis/type III secretory pathway M-ring protein FliF/YscJ